MHGIVPSFSERAIETAAKPTAETGSDSSSNWFSPACRQIIGKDPGIPLRIITGFPERTCYRYAAEGIPQGGDFVRALLRSEGGHVWLNVLMDGADPQWWRDLATARHLTERYRIELK